jgi:hypothetical protein
MHRPYGKDEIGSSINLPASHQFLAVPTVEPACYAVSQKETPPRWCVGGVVVEGDSGLPKTFFDSSNIAAFDFF